jgi:hypothetical protein
MVKRSATFVFRLLAGIKLIKLIYYKKIYLVKIGSVNGPLLCKYENRARPARLTIMGDYLVAITKSDEPTTSAIVGTIMTMVENSFVAISASMITLFPKLVGALRTTLCPIRRSR